MQTKWSITRTNALHTCTLWAGINWTMLADWEAFCWWCSAWLVRWVCCASSLLWFDADSPMCPKLELPFSSTMLLAIATFVAFIVRNLRLYVFYMVSTFGLNRRYVVFAIGWKLFNCHTIWYRCIYTNKQMRRRKEKKKKKEKKSN